VSIITTTIKGWFGHRVQHLAAAFTFYALLSLGPLLVIALTIATHVLDSGTAREQSIHRLAYFVGPEGASIINKIIDGAANAQHKIMTTSIGAIVLYLAGSAVFNSLHEAMNCIWEVPSGKRNTVLTFIRRQVITVLLVILIVSLFLMSLISSLILASVGTAISSVVTIPVFLMNLTDFSLSVVVFTGLFMFIFKIVPDVNNSWKEFLERCTDWCTFHITAVQYQQIFHKPDSRAQRDHACLWLTCIIYPDYPMGLYISTDRISWCRIHPRTYYLLSGNKTES